MNLCCCGAKTGPPSPCVFDLNGLGPTLYIYGSYYADCIFPPEGTKVYYTYTCRYTSSFPVVFFVDDGSARILSYTGPAWVSDCETYSAIGFDGNCDTFTEQIAFLSLNEISGQSEAGGTLIISAPCGTPWYSSGGLGAAANNTNYIAPYCYNFGLHWTNNPISNPYQPP
jgi:hypothetical protein